MNSNMMFMYDQSVSFKLVKTPPKPKIVEVLVEVEKPVAALAPVFAVALNTTSKQAVKSLPGVLRDWRTSPSIVGVYPTYRDDEGHFLFYSVWDGYHWLFDGLTLEEAQSKHQNRISRTQMRYWGDMVLEGKDPVVIPKVLKKNVWHEHKGGLLTFGLDVKVKLKRGSGEELDSYRSIRDWNTMYPSSLRQGNFPSLNITHFMILD